MDTFSRTVRHAQKHSDMTHVVVLSVFMLSCVVLCVIYVFFSIFGFSCPSRLFFRHRWRCQLALQYLRHDGFDFYQIDVDRFLIRLESNISSRVEQAKKKPNSHISNSLIYFHFSECHH